MILSVIVTTYSILLSSQDIDLKTAGQGGLTLKIQIINQSLLFNLRREERSENVWLVGEDGEMIKTEKKVKLYLFINSHIFFAFIPVDPKNYTNFEGLWRNS